MDENNGLIVKINELLLSKYGIPDRAVIPPNPLDLLIATILSQNTNDNNSYKAYNNIKSYFNNWKEILDVSDAELCEFIKPAGLCKQKTIAIKSILGYLYENYKNVSLDYLNTHSNDEIITILTAQKGIGVKTASCVLLFALLRNVCPVDTHVHRIINRLNIIKTKNPEESFYKLNTNFPKNIAHQFHTNLIKLGRNLCRPKNPKCNQCPLIEHCFFSGKDYSTNNNADFREFLLLDNI
ncbi:MAG: endonuclease III [bacterium]